jgi:hypothetical protein
VNARQFSHARRWLVDHSLVFGATRTALGDLHDLSAMTVQCFLPILRLKISVADGWFLP